MATKKELRRQITELSARLKKVESKVNYEDYLRMEKTVEEYKEVLDTVGEDTLNLRRALVEYLISEYTLNEKGKRDGTITAEDASMLIGCVISLGECNSEELEAWWRRRRLINEGDYPGGY